MVGLRGYLPFDGKPQQVALGDFSRADTEDAGRAQDAPDLPVQDLPAPALVRHVVGIADPAAPVPGQSSDADHRGATTVRSSDLAAEDGVRLASLAAAAMGLASAGLALTGQ
jgi:hypothetical protein